MFANVIDLEMSCYPGGVFPDGERQEIIEDRSDNSRPSDTARIITTRSLPYHPTMETR
ncbi:MAG: hypothetical protein IPI39_26010 [Candidatus Obscuribacter sp.]|nr:hypothetical protein [Candidatus Obscuribacter sp.]